MLLESWQWLRAHCDRTQRQLGYVGEAVAISARYARCREAWDSHLNHSKQFITQAIEQCARHRTALILGAGACLDVPLARLSSRFEKVVLVDAVKLAHTEHLIKPYKNVEYILHDISEVNQQLLRADGDMLLELSTTLPQRFVDDNTIDLVVSLNLLSQIPLLPMRWLSREKRMENSAINQLGLNLMNAHCRYLMQFKASRVLIFDAEQWLEDDNGVAHDCLPLNDWLQQQSLLPTPLAQHEWLWHVAPPHEQHGSRTIHRVNALLFAR